MVLVTAHRSARPVAYTCLNILTAGVNISTAKTRPKHLPGVNQCNMTTSGMSSRRAQVFLRQDPDVILVGEIANWQTPHRSKEARRAHGVGHAPHQDRPHPDADAQHGHRPLSHRVQRHPDTRAAAGPAPLPTARRRTTATRTCWKAGFTKRRGRTWTPLPAVAAPCAQRSGSVGIYHHADQRNIQCISWRTKAPEIASMEAGGDEVCAGGAYKAGLVPLERCWAVPSITAAGNRGQRWPRPLTRL